MMYLSPIIITGAARSRTSMVAGIINLCGAFGGKMRGPSEWNKKGFFENKRICEQVIKPYLVSLGVDPMGQNPLPDIDNLGDYSGDKWFQSIADIMISEGLQEEQSWFIKEAKACLIWPVLVSAFPRARWIIVRRDKGGIINSCLRAPFMCAFKDHEGWAGWLQHHIDRFAKMGDYLRFVNIWSDKIIAGDMSEIMSVIDWLGLAWDEAAVKDFIDPGITSHA